MSGIFDRLTHPQENVEDPDESLTPSEAEQDSDSFVFTSRQIKEAAQELLKHGLIEKGRKPNIYRSIISHQAQVDQILEPLDLTVRLDDIRGLAFVVVLRQQIDGSPEEDWSHPLIRRQRLSLEQSLLVAILRQQFIAHEQEAGVGAEEATVALEDLIPQLQLYLGSLGSELAEQKRIRNLLDALKGHGIVSDVDTHEQVVIRPLITHLANPENLQSLLHAFKAASSSESPEHDKEPHSEGAQ